MRHQILMVVPLSFVAGCVGVAGGIAERDVATWRPAQLASSPQSAGAPRRAAECPMMPGAPPFSPNRRYRVRTLKTRRGWHFQVRVARTGRRVFTTAAQYSTPTRVKSGAFSSDSGRFAAAYHYSGPPRYTWFGVWSTVTGKRVKTLTRPGYCYDASVAL